MKENVLVVPTSGINPLLTGVFTANNLDRCLKFILANYSFRDRALVEEDPSFKQIIPYVVVRHGSRYLLTQRTSRQTERRLHGKFSVGIGGHINDTESLAPGQTAEHIIEAGLERELNEEIHLRGQRQSLTLAGIISDDSTPVGQVHLGLVFVLETDSPDFAVNEADLMTAEWATLETLQERLDRMETWSQIALERIIAPAGRQQEVSDAIGNR